MSILSCTVRVHVYITVSYDINIITHMHSYISARLLCFQAIDHFASAPIPDSKQICRCLLNIASLLVRSPQTTAGRHLAVSQADVNAAYAVLKHLNSPLARNSVTSSMRQTVQVSEDADMQAGRLTCPYVRTCTCTCMIEVCHITRAFAVQGEHQRSRGVVS